MTKPSKLRLYMGVMLISRSLYSRLWICIIIRVDFTCFGCLKTSTAQVLVQRLAVVFDH